MFLNLFYTKSFIIGFIFYVGPQNIFIWASRNTRNAHHEINKTDQKRQKIQTYAPLIWSNVKGWFTLALIWHFTVTLGTYNSLPHVHTACPDSRRSSVALFHWATRKSLRFKSLNKYNCQPLPCLWKLTWNSWTWLNAWYSRYTVQLKRNRCRCRYDI